MDTLSSTIRRCNIQLKLDNPTEGYGNCFLNAIIQQYRRPEILAWLKENEPWAISTNHQVLRKKIKHFALNSQHKTLLDYKTNYQQILLQEDKTTWTDYWEKMGRVGTWIDSVFVQVTAWYIGLDIKILVTTAKAEHPFIIVTGSIDHINESSDGPQLLLGNYSNVHYQSLLPLTMGLNIRNNPSESNFEERNENTPSEETDDFIFMQNRNKVIFHSLKDNKLQCPFCNESFSRLVSHATSNKCNISKLNIDIKEFANQLNSFKDGFRLEKC